MYKKTCKISIITVCFNSAKTIEATIKSVLEQKTKDIEYIIIDGGSTDNTLDIIKKYEKHLAYWVSEPDKGISDAFNKGIMKSTGEIIGIINADDKYMENATEAALEVFDNNPEIGFVFGDLVYIDIDDNILFTQKGDPNYLETILGTMPSIPHPTVFVRKDVYQNYGMFNLFLRTAMDYEFLLRISKMHVRGFYIPKVMAAMRLGGESDNNYVNAYREVFLVSIFYSYSLFKGGLWFIVKTIKTTIKKLFERLHFNKLIKTYRAIFSSRYVYK